MAGSPPNLHTMDSRSACIQDVLKVKVKGHVMRALSWILGMSYSVIDGLVAFSRRYIFPTKLLYQIITSGFYQWLFIDIETDDPE